MKSIASVLATVLLLVLAMALAAFLVANDPDTATLDSDIINTREQIRSAEELSARYSGGLLKNYIDLRVDTYKLTEAMLIAKRTSILR